MRVGIAADHAGFGFKENLANELRDLGHDVVDFGAKSLSPGDDYPDYVVPLAEAVRSGNVQRGLAICGSGVGASIVANKVRGVRAGLCHDTYSAHQGVEHDDVNILVLGARVIGLELAKELVNAFLGARFTSDQRHIRRLDKVASLEARGFGENHESKECSAMNPLQQLHELGQAIWLDDIHRSLMTSGDLKQLIDEDRLCGMTSNPTIFDKAIAGSHDYDDDIRELALKEKGVNDIFEALSVRDVQMAADTFRPVYDRTDGAHGFVSLEVSPCLAHDTDGTLAEARRLWSALDRPNVFIKVPATLGGLAAIRQLTSEGINVNITLLFGLPRYREVAEAYIAGIEERLARRQDVRHVRSVASFFLSRIDVLIDPMLEQIRQEGGDNAELAESLLGQTAIASAKQAYQIYNEITSSDHWKKLADSGAWPQWLLWASTSTKDPQYSDVMYVEPLIGPETVNTVPILTLEAYRAHGDPEPRLEAGVDQARQTLDSLSKLNIDIDRCTQQLEDEGIEKFSTSLDKLLETLASEVATARDSTTRSAT